MESGGQAMRTGVIWDLGVLSWSAIEERDSESRTWRKGTIPLAQSGTPNLTIQLEIFLGQSILQAALACLKQVIHSLALLCWCSHYDLLHACRRTLCLI